MNKLSIASNNNTLNLKSIVSHSFDTEAYDQSFNTVQERASFVLECFDSEFNNSYEIQRTPNKQARIASWLQGLPTVCTVPFYNYHILVIGKELHNLSFGATKNAEQKYLDNWFNLMAFTLIKLSEMKKHASTTLDNYDDSRVIEVLNRLANAD